MFDIKENYLSSWGGFGNSSEQLNKPESIAVDNKGRIYVRIQETPEFRY